MAKQRKNSVVVCECLALIMLILVTGCQTSEQSEIGKFQGKWVLTRIVSSSGKEIFNEDKDKNDFYLTVSANTFEMKSGPNKASGTVNINTGTNPKEIDLTYDNVSNGKHVGKTQLSIYKFKGNKLYLAGYETWSQERPKKFEYCHIMVLRKQ